MAVVSTDDECGEDTLMDTTSPSSDGSIDGGSPDTADAKRPSLQLPAPTRDLPEQGLTKISRRNTVACELEVRHALTPDGKTGTLWRS